MSFEGIECDCSMRCWQKGLIMGLIWKGKDEWDIGLGPHVRRLGT